MSNAVDGASVRAVTQGILVRRATATIAADADIFSITGGDVLLIGFWGKVTTEVGAGSQDIAIHLDPDDGGTDVALATILLCDGDVTGTYYTLNATSQGVLVATLDVAFNGILDKPIILSAGDIVMDVTGTEAGSVAWNMIYAPLDAGATVADV